MSAVYNHKTVEKKWQQVWQDYKARLRLPVEWKH